MSEQCSLSFCVLPPCSRCFLCIVAAASLSVCRCVNSIPAMLAFTRQHGGYNLALLVPGLGFDPTSVLPLSTDCERTHDLHHRLSNCNYGASFYVWDRLMGTWVDPEAEEEKQFSRKQVVPIGNEGETNNNTQNKKQL